MNSSNIESGIQLFSRVNRKTFLEGINPPLFPGGGPFPNQVVEITGDSKVDKTDLLIDFIVKCILPNKYPEWKASGAVLILCEHQINMFKIIKVIETQLKNKNVLDPTKEILETCLKNLTIFNCYSAEELDITIMSLERLILANDNISLIIIDNITSYYWIAKLDCITLSYHQHSMNIFQKIYNVIKTLNILLIYGKNEKANSGNKKGFQNVDYRIDIQASDNNFLKASVMDFVKQNIETYFIFFLCFQRNLDEKRAAHTKIIKIFLNLLKLKSFWE